MKFKLNSLQMEHKKKSIKNSPSVAYLPRQQELKPQGQDSQPFKQSASKLMVL